jgi:hypothetical protein
MGGVAVTQVRFMSVEGEERIVARTGFVRRLLWAAELQQLINTLWRERPASRWGREGGAPWWDGESQVSNISNHAV